MSSTALITIDSSYPIAVYVVLPIITVYAGLFLAVSNHYVLRPKIEAFLQKASISSALASQIIIDVLSNLSFISYAICAFFLISVNDYSFRLLQYYNMHWLTLGLAVVMYLKIPNDQTLQYVMISKNGIFLGLCFVNLLYHYFAGSTLISMPLVFVGIYFFNLISNAYEQKFIQFVYDLFAIKVTLPQKPKAKLTNKRPTIQYLSKTYPITKMQLDKKLQISQKKKTNKFIFKNTRMRKNSSQIDTKIVAKQRLMQICTCIHLSLAKKQQQQINTVKQYFGFMNGTMSQKSELNKARFGFKHRKTYYNNRNKTNKTAKIGKKLEMSNKQIQKAEKQNEKKDQILQMTGNYLMQKNSMDKEEQLNFEGMYEEQSFLFYIFPVRIFEFSKIISSVFSVLINLGFGILLSYCQNVMSTLAYGRFCQYALALLLMPMIPQTSPLDYICTMALASIWKYGICGLFATMSIAANTDGSLYGSWTLTNYFQYQTIVQIAALFIAFVVTFTNKNRYKFFIVVFLMALAGNAGITYLSIIS